MRKKKLIILGTVNLILLLLVSIVLLRGGYMKGMLHSQRAAGRFAGLSGERFAQISVFYPQGSGIGMSQIESFRDSLEAKMTEASLEAPETGSLWIDAWSMQSSLQVKGARGNASATAIGVGGNYFFFHPLRLRSGSYISDSDFSNDLVVLNEELAWQLFGATNVTGMEVTINGIPYIVAGVVEREKDFASEKAGNEGPCIYISYEHLASEQSASFTCYEIVLPDPVSGFAYKTVNEGSIRGSGEALQNTGRFSIGKLWKIIWSFGERSMHQKGIIYPYWENAARLVEDHLALLFVFAVLLAIFPAACGLNLLRWAYKKLMGKRKSAFNRLDRKWEQLRIRRYESKKAERQ
ncbi:MAG: ABC transporter permease [Clostridiales bacterium]|jgi:hypothetical protein|nr:ABC transporter permease [Clostridiales bacterium]